MRLLACLGWFCFLIVSCTASELAEITPLEKRTISPTDDSKRGPDAKAFALDLLAGLSPKRPMPPTVLIKDRQYVLYGNLFQTGENYALIQIDLPTPGGWSDGFLGFALLQDGKWQLRGLWDIPVIWHPEGCTAKENNYFPKTPASKAFELVDLVGKRTPEVIVASDVDKYFQDFYLFSFLPREKSLQPLGASMAPPERVGKYIRFYDQSPRRAIWEEWTYYEWENSALSEVASWHDEVPYYESQEPLVIVRTFNKATQPGTFSITQVNIDDSPSETSYAIASNGQHYATVTFTLKHPATPGSYPFENSHALQYAWLFHHLTGLPRNCYPSETKNLPPFEKFGTVQVTGTPEAVKRLSGRK